MTHSFLARAHACKNAVAKKLFQLMVQKKTNLAVSADLVKSAEILKLAELIGPEICVLKTHVDIINDFTPDFLTKLTAIAKRHDFLIFEDRKFADIGNTVKHQYSGGIYRIADWADMVNAHLLPGPGIIQGLAEVGLAKDRGLLLLAEMSSVNNLFTPEYTKQTLQYAREFADFVFGFISQRKLSDEPYWIYMTPGVQFAEKSDALGQQYITPEKAIKENGSDIIIVGRGIIHAEDPLTAAQKYRAAAWTAVSK